MSDPHIPHDDDGWSMSARRTRAVQDQVMRNLSATPALSDRPFPTTRGVLSKDEIEALLRPDLSDLPDDEPEPTPTAPRPVGNFAVQEPVVTEAAREQAARLAARLSLALRRDCHLEAAATLNAVIARAFSEGLQGLEADTATACYANEEGEIVAMLAIGSALSNRLIELACGGHEPPAALPPRDLTQLDVAMLEGLLGPLGPAIDPSLTLARIETNAAFARALAPPGRGQQLSLSIVAGGFDAEATLILLAGAVKDKTAAQPALDAAPLRQRLTDDPSATPHGIMAALTARVASLSVPMSKISGLRPGATLMLGLPADQPIELLSGGRDGPLVAEGEVGRKGNKMAVRITRKGPMIR